MLSVDDPQLYTEPSTSELIVRLIKSYDLWVKMGKVVHRDTKTRREGRSEARIDESSGLGIRLKTRLKLDNKAVVLEIVPHQRAS